MLATTATTAQRTHLAPGALLPTEVLLCWQAGAHQTMVVLDSSLGPPATFGDGRSEASLHPRSRASAALG